MGSHQCQVASLFFLWDARKRAPLDSPFSVVFSKIISTPYILLKCVDSCQVKVDLWPSSLITIQHMLSAPLTILALAICSFVSKRAFSLLPDYPYRSIQVELAESFSHWQTGARREKKWLDLVSTCFRIRRGFRTRRSMGRIDRTGYKLFDEVRMLTEANLFSPHFFFIC